MERSRNGYAQSLCWYCINSVPSKDGKRGCSWSRELKPVPGWEAEEMEHCKAYSQITAYKVKKCPEFVDAGYDSLCVPIGEQRRRRK